MKCRNSAFNVQGSRVIIIAAVQVGAVKIYMQHHCRRSGKRKDKMKLNLLSPTPPLLNANVLIFRVFEKSHPVYDQTQGSGSVFSLLYGYRYYIAVF
jgi:hypothetical protein